MFKTNRTLTGISTTALFWLFAGGAWAGLPVGSVVLYSDGRVEKLLSREDDRLLWEDDRKRRILRAENPIVPDLERTAFLSGKGYTQTVTGGNPDAIRARPKGDRFEFTVNRVRHNGNSSARRWECIRLDTVKKKVLGVMRDLESYACERFIYHRKTWQRQFRESRDFLFSPDLGLVVEMNRKTRKKSSAWELVAVLPPHKTGYKRLSKKVRRLRGSR